MKDFKWKILIALSISILILIIIVFFVDIDNNVSVRIVRNNDDYLIVTSENLLHKKLQYQFENFSSYTYFNYLYTENGLNYYYATLEKIPIDNIMIIKNGKIKIYELIMNLF